jgi:endonuclease III
VTQLTRHLACRGAAKQDGWAFFEEWRAGPALTISRVMRKASRQKRAALAELVFERLAAANPEPMGELAYINPFTLLVAVVLSAQATDAGVNKATKTLFAVADTPDKMLALGAEKLAERIKTIGLYRAKARHIIALSRTIADEYGGQTPKDRAALESLPGVGRKTANVVLNTAFGAPTIAVDTHVFRVANRVGIAPGKTPREVEDELMRVIPERFLRHAHHWLILHGRYICRARTPLCGSCLLNDLCLYEDKTPAV